MLIIIIIKVSKYSHDAPLLTNFETEMFSVYAGNARCSVSCRRCGGKLFHTRGPAALKLRSPKLFRVRGTKHVLAAAERSDFVELWAIIIFIMGQRAMNQVYHGPLPHTLRLMHGFQHYVSVHP